MPTLDRPPRHAIRPLRRREMIGRVGVIVSLATLAGCGRKPNRLQPPPEREEPMAPASPDDAGAPTGTR
jgi:predicted small lipoprotein YifL